MTVGCGVLVGRGVGVGSGLAIVGDGVAVGVAVDSGKGVKMGAGVGPQPASSRVNTMTPRILLAYFPQYISLFIGAVVYRRGWLSAISEDFARGRLWGPVLAVLLVLAPVLFVLGGALEGDVGPFLGGLHWQALAYALLACFPHFKN